MTDCIKLKNIYKAFDKKKLDYVLADVNLDIKTGSIYGILGPSGCGKTTTVKIIAGILKATKGSVEVLGEKMPSFNSMAQIGYMAQSTALYETLNGEENLYFFGKLYGLHKEDLQYQVDQVLELVGLDSDRYKQVRAYSDGMKRRLALAVSLVHSPSVLILDEPTVGIDPILRAEIWKAFRKLADKGVSILVTTHVMDEADKCDYLAIMREGEILITGTPDGILEQAKSKTIEEAFIKLGKEADYEN